MFLGLLGFFLVITGISLLILTFWKPGGVRHAQRATSDQKGKEQAKAEIDLIRSSVEVNVADTELHHVRRTVPSGNIVETPILQNVNAIFRSGELSCIMGPSGSGKSTLLRMIAGHPMKSGPLGTFVPKGSITFNGELVSHRTRHLCAFVEQDDDYHMPALTVRETLRYAAILKLPKSVSRKRKMARAEEVLKMLGLRDCADGMVGGELLKGISGGEKRRLSLACEMINDPAVLVVDEASLVRFD
jgi:ABC-type multidrug transport system ATPase subunit